VVAFCAVVLVIGGLAAFFEQAAIVRILGALAAVLALVVGSFIARGAWPKRPTAEV
jgi:disulfide bond formation protein DsbB